MRVLSKERRGHHGERVFDTVIVKGDRVTAKTSVLRQGVNKHSGKTYARFQDTEARSYVYQKGRIRVFDLPVRYPNGTRSNYRDMTTWALNNPRHGAHSPDREGMVDSAFADLFGGTRIEVMSRMYPSAKVVAPLDGLTPHLVAKDMSELTMRVFGKQRYRKDLVKALSTVPADYGLRAGRDLRGFQFQVGMSLPREVPIDWFIRWANTGDPVVGVHRWTPGPHLPTMTQMWKTADIAQIRRLLFSGEEEFRGVRDIVRGFRQARTANPEFALSSLDFRSWDELEAQLTLARHSVQHQETPIEYKGRAKTLAGAYGPLTIVAPATNLELFDWSSAMSNCISGYAHPAQQGQTALYAVMEGDRMVANMELNPKTGDVRQLLGRFNKSVEPEVKTAVVDAIHSVWPNANTEGGWQ